MALFDGATTTTNLGLIPETGAPNPISPSPQIDDLDRARHPGLLPLHRSIHDGNTSSLEPNNLPKRTRHHGRAETRHQLGLLPQRRNATDRPSAPPSAYPGTYTATPAGAGAFEASGGLAAVCPRHWPRLVL